MIFNRHNLSKILNWDRILTVPDTNEKQALINAIQVEAEKLLQADSIPEAEKVDRIKRALMELEDRKLCSMQVQ